MALLWFCKPLPFYKEIRYFTLKMKVNVYKDNYKRKGLCVLLLLMCIVRCSWNQQLGYMQTWQNGVNAIQHYSFL